MKLERYKYTPAMTLVAIKHCDTVGSLTLILSVETTQIIDFALLEVVRVPDRPYEAKPRPLAYPVSYELDLSNTPPPQTWSRMT